MLLALAVFSTGHRLLDAADRELASPHGADPEGLESVAGGDTTGEELVRR